MKLRVTIPSKQINFSIQVAEDADLAAIKERLISKRGVDLRTQVIVLQDKVIKEDLDLWCCRALKDGSELQLREDKMFLVINVPNPWSYKSREEVTIEKTRLLVKLTTTVLGLKKFIAQQHGIPAELQRLSLNQQSLNDAQMLTACGVKNRSELDLEVGKTLSLQLSGTLEVFAPLGRTVNDVLKMAFDAQNLWFAGKFVPSRVKISSSKIQNRRTFDLRVPSDADNIIDVLEASMEEEEVVEEREEGDGEN